MQYVGAEEYKRRHDNVAKYVHWRLCEKYELDKANKWYDHKPDGLIENTNYKILWDVMIQCDREIEARRPDIVVVDKQKREVKIIDIAIPGDVRVCEKEIEKIDKYKPLKDEIARLWQMQKRPGMYEGVDIPIKKITPEVGDSDNIKAMFREEVLEKKCNNGPRFVTFLFTNQLLVSGPFGEACDVGMRTV
ncbi:uncharacterized protein LOC134775554 [Penaeus indicus]|uniref:uncharacterized protein LOC134775554 n=1 Tax=Penaeus indicus TaxID=29960 RepID=UPI00300CC55C